MIDIAVNDLQKEYQVGQPVLTGLTFQVDTGERVGILGKNGAGKTTLFRILTGQEEATVTLTLSREQMPEGFPEEVPISQAEGELKLPLLQDGDTTFYLTAFARSDEDPGTLYAVIQPEHQLSREGGQLLLPYRIDEDGGITAQLRVSDLPVQADGEDRPDATRLASQGPGEQFALYVDRALFLRSDAITIQLGSFYRLTYAPA